MQAATALIRKTASFGSGICSLGNCISSAQTLPIGSQQALTGPHNSTQEFAASLCKAKEMDSFENEWAGFKIRRYLVPWGFDSPSRHQLKNPQNTRLAGLALRMPCPPSADAA